MYISTYKYIFIWSPASTHPLPDSPSPGGHKFSILSHSQVSPPFHSERLGEFGTVPTTTTHSPRKDRNGISPTGRSEK